LLATGPWVPFPSPCLEVCLSVDCAWQSLSRCSPIHPSVSLSSTVVNLYYRV
jgi:hypothetical protein